MSEIVEYCLDWSDGELAAMLHRLRDAGGGTAYFGQNDQGATPGIEDPEALQRQLFEIGYAQRPRIIPSTEIVRSADGNSVLVCRVGEFTIRDMPCYQP